MKRKTILFSIKYKEFHRKHDIEHIDVFNPFKQKT
jgi:hypothetical protein